MRCSVYVYITCRSEMHTATVWDKRRWQANTNNRYEHIARWQTLCICLPSSGWQARTSRTHHTNFMCTTKDLWFSGTQAVGTHKSFARFGHIVIRTCRPGPERAENQHFRCEAVRHFPTRPIWTNHISREHTTQSSIWQCLKSSMLRNCARAKGYMH